MIMKFSIKRLCMFTVILDLAALRKQKKLRRVSTRSPTRYAVSALKHRTGTVFYTETAPVHIKPIRKDPLKYRHSVSSRYRVHRAYCSCIHDAPADQRRALVCAVLPKIKSLCGTNTLNSSRSPQTTEFLIISH